MSCLYVAFDVETPNRMNNRISSIGITTFTLDGILCTEDYLVNPECGFDELNISLTGISPRMVEDAPIFPDVWKKIEHLFSGNIIIAHNARFDLSVLQKTLTAYGISMPPIQYICTLTMAQNCVHGISSYKLSTLCDYYSVSLNHHNAGSDSRACAALLLKLIEEGNNPDKYINDYCFCVGQDDIPKKQVFSETTQAINELKAVLEAISCDGILTEREIAFLVNWMNKNSHLSGSFPYDRIYNKLVTVLEDGIVSNEEHDELIRLFRSVNDPVGELSCPCVMPNIVDKNICLTGEFDYGSRDSVSLFLREKGANLLTSVTRKTDILIVGGHGSSEWCLGNYGSKIKKALELQAKGSKIQIVRETDFFNTIEG